MNPRPPVSAAPRPDAAGLPVWPGEEPWTAAELAQVRAELVGEAEGLRAEIAKTAHDIAEGLTGSLRDAGDDEADAGTRAVEREHELAPPERPGLLDKESGLGDDGK